MKYLLAIASLVMVWSMVEASAQTGASTVTPTPAQAPAPTPMAFKPLVFHAPAGDLGGVLPIRVGGGSRGGAATDLSIEVLVPDQVALTTQAQPSLYWYQSKEAEAPCEITITEPKNPKPLLSLKSSQTTPPGIHAVRLSKFNVKLKPDVVYRWSVAIVVDPANRSQDIIANGVIKRINPPPDLADKLGQASDSDKPALYAENGIWYDALQSISDQIDHAPQNASLQVERTELLKQVGINDARMADSSVKSP